MKFDYTGRHIEVTPALRTHVESQFEKIDHLFNGSDSQAHVIIEVERGRHRSEVVVSWKNEVLSAATSNSDMYLSLTQTIAKIGKQASKLKDKIIDKSHKAAKVSTIPVAESDITPTPSAPRIISARRYAVKPMPAEEAALQLSDEENQFLVFRNAENDKVSVIYKRKDGNYGLIQP